MSTISRAEIATRTGLPESTISRHLRGFRGARLSKGKYDLTHPQLSAWLSYRQTCQSVDTSSEVGERPTRSTGGIDRDHWVLPSGLPLSAHLFRLLREPDESEALSVLDRTIARYRMTPHPAVPDLSTYVPLELPSGTIINQSQFHILRRGTERAASVAMDVLIRSYSPRESKQ